MVDDKLELPREHMGILQIVWDKFGAFWWSEFSEAWGPPQFQEKRSRSERAILGALGEFRGILGAALGIGNSIAEYEIPFSEWPLTT